MSAESEVCVLAAFRRQWQRLLVYYRKSDNNFNVYENCNIDLLVSCRADLNVSLINCSLATAWELNLLLMPGWPLTSKDSLPAIKELKLKPSASNSAVVSSLSRGEIIQVLNTSNWEKLKTINNSQTIGCYRDFWAWWVQIRPLFVLTLLLDRSLATFQSKHMIVFTVFL